MVASREQHYLLLCKVLDFDTPEGIVELRSLAVGPRNLTGCEEATVDHRPYIDKDPD